MSESKVQEPVVAEVEGTNGGKLNEVRKTDSEREQKDVSKKTEVRRIWIDLDNSPHVPFFLPIAEELRKRGYEVILTARDSYQVCDLVKLHKVSCQVIGKHWGRHRLMKIFGTFVRALQLAFYMRGKKVDLAISHVSRSQMLSSFLLGIQTLTIADYEFIAKVGFQKSDWVFTPESIETSVAPQARHGVMKYPGLKEDVYVPNFHADPSLKRELRLKSDDLVITVRPPATEAHYHNPEGEILLDATLRMLVERPDTRVILLPRNERQEGDLRKTWGNWIENRKIVIPSKVVDGLNLIWHSDLVISGGGTMNREAAALGVPVYSIFRGRIGSVDRFLAATGRLTLVENVEALRAKVRLERKKTGDESQIAQGRALEYIVAGISAIVEKRPLPSLN